MGYGDVTPHSVIGRAIASVGMLIGYAVIAVPTGIITAELTVSQRAHNDKQAREARNCSNCAAVEQDPEAHYCRACGTALPEPSPGPTEGQPSA